MISFCFARCAPSADTFFEKLEKVSFPRCMLNPERHERRDSAATTGSKGRRQGPLTPMGGWTGVLVNENPRWRSISPFARVESWTPPNVWSIDSSRRADEGCVSSFPKF